MALPVPKRSSFPDMESYGNALRAYRASLAKTNDMATATPALTTVPTAPVIKPTIQDTGARYTTGPNAGNLMEGQSNQSAGVVAAAQNRAGITAGTVNPTQQAAARTEAMRAGLANSTTINNYTSTDPADIQAQKDLNTKYNLAPNTGLTGKPVTRDLNKESAVDKNLGSGTPAQKYIATYGNEKTANLIEQGKIPVNQFSEEELAKLGLTPERLQKLAEGDPTVQKLIDSMKAKAGDLQIAQANSEATPAPTNSKLQILADAIDAKSNYRNQALGTSDLFKMAGLSGYSVLAQSMQQRSAEMKQKGENVNNLIARAGGTMMDEYKMLADNYQKIQESYDKQMERLLDIDKTAKEHEFLVDQATTAFDREKELYSFKAAKDAEAKEAELKDIFGDTGDITSTAGANKIGDKDFEAQLGEIFGAGKTGDWCGLFAGLVSDAGDVGDLWPEKRKNIDEFQGTPTAGDKILVPAGVASGVNPYGHVMVAITAPNANGDFYVADSNGDGRQKDSSKGPKGERRISIQNINDLNSKYGSDWGIKNGELRPSYKAALEKILPPDQDSVTKTLNKLKGNPAAYARLQTLTPKMATSIWNMAGTTPTQKTENINRILAGEDASDVLHPEKNALPPEVSWVETALQNTLGGVVKGAENVETKRAEFKKLIEEGRNKEAATMAFNSIFGKLSPAEKAKMTDLMNINRNYDDIDSALGELKKLAGKDPSWQPGLFAGSYNDLLSIIKKERPKEVVELKARIDRAYANYGKSISGAAVSEQEAERLLKQFPTLWSPGSEGKILTDELKRQAGEELDTNISINSQNMFNSSDELNTALDLIRNGEYGNYKEKRAEDFNNLMYVGTRVGEMILSPFSSTLSNFLNRSDVSELDNIYK